MRIVLLGAPGSGKGTQGHVLSERLGVPHISSGDLLRYHIRENTPLGAQVVGYVRGGHLVPDDLILQVMWEAVLDASERGGYILDGFPRTLDQAQRAYELAKGMGLTADAVVHLTVPDDAVRERLALRAVEGRADDADPDVIERRLRLYHADTEPLLDYYRERGILVDIVANRPMDEVTAAVLSTLGIPAWIAPRP